MNSMKLDRGRNELTPMDTQINTDMSDTDFNVLLARLHAIPKNAPPEQTAKEFFPDDKVGQREYLKQVAALQKAVDKAQATTKPGARGVALPAAAAALLPVIQLCVIGGLSSTVVNELYLLVAKNRRGTAEERVTALVLGCISSVIPFFARSTARRFSKPIARLILRVILRRR
jgi:hypothetical protein